MHMIRNHPVILYKQTGSTWLQPNVLGQWYSMEAMLVDYLQMVGLGDV